MTREDALVLLNGLMHYFEDHWAFADLSDEEIEDSYKDLNKFDSDEDIRYGLIECLKDYRDAFEEVAWCIDTVVAYMEDRPIDGYQLLTKMPFDKPEAATAKSTMSTKMRDFYTAAYPSDDIGEDLSPTATFQDLFDALDSGKDVYSAIFGDNGMGDSIVRERLFEELSVIMDCDYDYIYRMWLAN